MWKEYGVAFSPAFCAFFAEKIDDILRTQGGLKPSTKVGLSLFKPEGVENMYVPGAISRIHTAISILPDYYGPISFCWRSKTGKLVQPGDEAFDADDLEVWVEGLQPAEYWKVLSKTQSPHLLRVKDLPYELVVQDLALHQSITVVLANESQARVIVEALEGEVGAYNKASEKKGDGILHHTSHELHEDGFVYRMDMGSAGIAALRRLLLRLAKFEAVKKVTLSY